MKLSFQLCAILHPHWVNVLHQLMLTPSYTFYHFFYLNYVIFLCFHTCWSVEIQLGMTNSDITVYPCHILDDSVERSDLSSSNCSATDHVNDTEIKAQGKQIYNNSESKGTELSLLDLYSGCGGMSTGLCLGAQVAGVKLVTARIFQLYVFPLKPWTLSIFHGKIRLYCFLLYCAAWYCLLHRDGLLTRRKLHVWVWNLITQKLK